MPRPSTNTASATDPDSAPARDRDHVAATLGPTRIDYDRACSRCGYNLVGLELSGVCPECGAKITGTRRRRPPRFADQLVHAPVEWLRPFRLACAALAYSGVTMIWLLLIWAVWDQPGLGFVALASSFLWCAGSVLVTRPRPAMPWMEQDPSAEWGIERAVVRASQGLWALGIALLIFSTDASAGAPLVRILAIVVLGGAVAGACVLMWYVSNLAHWAADTSLAYGLRGATWMLAVVGLCGVFLWDMPNAVLGTLSPGNRIVPWYVPLAFLSALVPAIYVAVVLIGLNRLGAWVLSSHGVAKARLERFRAKAAAEAELTEWERTRRPAGPPAPTPDVGASSEIEDVPETPWRHPHEGFVERGEPGPSYDVDPQR